MLRNLSLIIVAAVLLCLAQSGTGQAQTKKSGGGGGAVEHANKGVKLAQTGAYEEAIVEFTTAIKISPNDARIYNDRGRVYHRMNRFPEAIEDFSKAIEIAPKDYAGYSERGAVQVSQNQMEAALADLNKALELKPDDAQTLRFRAAAYRGLKQYDLAIQDFTAVLSKTDPNSSDQARLAAADLFAKRGYIYNLAQRYENAINDFKEALRLNPNDIDTPQRLQYAESMLAAKNAPPPTATPTPTPSPTEFCHALEYWDCDRGAAYHCSNRAPADQGKGGAHQRKNSLGGSSAPSLDVKNGGESHQLATCAAQPFHLQELQLIGFWIDNQPRNFFDTPTRAASVADAFCWRGGPLVVQIANLMRLWDF